jgi:hypothetical protein
VSRPDDRYQIRNAVLHEGSTLPNKSQLGYVNAEREPIQAQRFYFLMWILESEDGTKGIAFALAGSGVVSRASCIGEGRVTAYHRRRARKRHVGILTLPRSTILFGSNSSQRRSQRFAPGSREHFND